MGTKIYRAYQNQFHNYPLLKGHQGQTIHLKVIIMLLSFENISSNQMVRKLETRKILYETWIAMEHIKTKFTVPIHNSENYSSKILLKVSKISRQIKWVEGF